MEDNNNKPKVRIATSLGLARKLEQELADFNSEFDIKVSYRIQLSVGSDPNIFNFTYFHLNDIYEHFRGMAIDAIVLYLAKGAFMKFMTWVESKQGTILSEVPIQVEHQFGDITIRMGLTKANHIHALALVISEISKVQTALSDLALPPLTKIATPLKQSEKGDWWFYIPESDFDINKYTSCYGCELGSGHKLVRDKSQPEPLFVDWKAL